MNRSRVRTTPSTAVTIDPFDPANHRSFIATFERIESADTGVSADISSYSVVIRNASSRPVESIVIAWLARGKSHHSILDGYWNPPRQPVLLPGKQMLVNPSGALPEALPEHFYTFSLPGPHGFFPRVSILDGKLKVEPDDDADVEAAIDSVIFDDGTKSGPDVFGIVGYLRSRQAAAEAIVNGVEHGLAHGRTIEEALAALHVGEDRHHHLERFVSQVRRNPSFLDFLEEIRKLGREHP